MKTFDDLYNYAKDNGLEKTKLLLREYVKAGQPDEFMPGFTMRAMARCAGMAIDGTPANDYVGLSYMDTKFGSDIYWFMNGADQQKGGE